MNAVEIEEAVSKLAEAPFNAETFPYDFLQAFGLNDAGIRKLRSGDANKSDLPGGVLQRTKNNIHLLACPPGDVAAAMDALRASPATVKHKARFILATDGQTMQAERFEDGEPLACEFRELPDRFAYFLSLAGISTVKRIDENAFDIRATGRLNKLYVELLKENPAWDTDARRQALNHFFARLIFCFFAEDTNIFPETQLFTRTVEQMTVRDGSNTHEVLAKLSEAMNTPREKRAEARHLPASALKFPYVNGNLFAVPGNADVLVGTGNADVPVGTGNADVPVGTGNADVPVGTAEKADGDVGVPQTARADADVGVPRFNQAARNYLLFVGKLDWKKINPDIFGSMIQAVADDEERGALGMHYTSVPNILKVLNPLFLDDLRTKLHEAGDGKTPGSVRKLLNLRNRLARIRVFDPACGSGNFLVIAYKEMRAIEAIINDRRGELDRKSDIPISNFRGIELRHFPAEVARLALIIAEFQCDVLYRSELLARTEFLPLSKENWIVCANALRVDWLTVCPPTGTGVKIESDGLFKEKLEQVEIDFENAGGETYICGNPPYLGSKWQSDEHKADLASIFDGRVRGWKSLDYVAGWFLKAADYGTHTNAATAFVSTNSIVQGQQVLIIWPLIFATGHEIFFAHTSFKWANLASHNAGVTVVIVGISRHAGAGRNLYAAGENGETVQKRAENINGYLVPGGNIEIKALTAPADDRAPMQFGNHTYYGVDLLLTRDEAAGLVNRWPEAAPFLRDFLGSQEVISGLPRKCLWISTANADEASTIPGIEHRIQKVAAARRKMKKDKSAQKLANTPYKFREDFVGRRHVVVMPAISSENRPYLPATVVSARHIVGHKCYALYDAPLWNMSLISSRLHWVWIGTVCARLELRFSYSNTLGWNTFPVPPLTDQNKADLTRCAEDILLAREAHFPATIADLYAPGNADVPVGSSGNADGDVGVPRRGMPADLRAAHDRNDETLERIYIGRRFRNDTERLEKLFELYTEMTGGNADVRVGSGRKRKKKADGDVGAAGKGIDT